jgi:8-oxo-dGTP diphosphatase
VDAGETVEQAAARELHEETGLVATRFRRGPWVETHFVEGVQSISLFVVAHDTVGPPALREPEQCDGWHWMPWTALPAPLFAPLGQIVAAGYHPAAG